MYREIEQKLTWRRVEDWVLRVQAGIEWNITKEEEEVSGFGCRVQDNNEFHRKKF